MHKEASLVQGEMVDIVFTKCINIQETEGKEHKDGNCRNFCCPKSNRNSQVTDADDTTRHFHISYMS